MTPLHKASIKQIMNELRRRTADLPWDKLLVHDIPPGQELFMKQANRFLGSHFIRDSSMTLVLYKSKPYSEKILNDGEWREVSIHKDPIREYMDIDGTIVHERRAMR